MLGAHLVVSIVANLVVFMAILAAADGVLHYCGELIGHPGVF
jgi:nucleoside permease NupC